MRKVSNKLFAYFSVLTMLVGFFLPNYTYIVNATEGEEVESGTEVSFTNVEDGVINLDVDENNSKDITVSTLGYTLDTCDGGSLVSVSFENGTCTVKALEYGKTYVTLSYVKEGEMVSREVTYPVSIEYDEYFNYILNKLPKEYEVTYDYTQGSLQEIVDNLLPNSFSVYFDDERNFDENGNNICNTYNPDQNICYGFLVYRYQLDAYDEETRSVEFSVTIKDDVSDNISWSEFIVDSISSQYIKVGDIVDLAKDEYRFDDSNKYFWVSEDNNIAKVNTRNQLVGVSEGSTTIRLVNKKTLEYISFEVYVESNLTKRPLVDFLSMFDGTLEIDVSAINDFNPSPYGALNYFNSFSDEIDGAINLWGTDITCADGLNDCIITYSYKDVNWSDYNGQQTSTFDIVYKGLSITNLYNSYETYANKKYVYLDKTNGFALYNFEGVEPVLTYDESMVQITKGEDVQYVFTPLKEGTTTIEFMVNGYMDSITLEILFNESEINQLEEFYNNLDKIDVPFSMEDANLELIKSFVTAYIKDANKGNTFANYIKIDVIELKDKDIQLSLKINYYGRTLFSYKFYTKFVNLNFGAVSDENTYKALEDLKKNIKDEYVATVDGSIYLANEYTGDDFYNTLINQVPLMHDANSSNGLFNVQVVYGGTYNFNQYLLGGVYYDIYIYKDEVLVGIDRAFIKPNFLIDRSVHDNDNQVTAIDYISNVIKNITNEEYEVENIKDNYYRVKGKNTFNVVYDHKVLMEAEEARVYLADIDLISLDVEEERQLELLYRPFTATYVDSSFHSSNTNVFTVDDEGLITGVGKGSGILSFSDSNSLYYYLVTVGYSGTEFIDELLEPFNFNHIEIEYDQLDIWEDEVELLSNYIWRKLVDKYDENYMGIYSFDVEVKEDNGAYRYVACIYGICSEEQEFTFEYVGINSNLEEIVLSVGESKKAEVVYTEGNLSDLRYTVINRDIARVDSTGAITALSTGRTYLKIYDKKHEYVRHVPIVVDIDDHINNMIEEVKNKTYNINYIAGDDYYTERSIAYAIDTELCLDGYNFADAIYGNEYSNQADFSVDFENKIITYTYDLGYKEYVITTKFNFVGFSLENSYFEIEIGDSIFVSYATIDGGEPTLKSLNTNICSVEEDENGYPLINGISTGICNVVVSYDGYEKEVVILVDYDGIGEKMFENITVPSEIELKLDKYDTSRRADPDYNDIYDAAVRNYFNKFIEGKKHYDVKLTNVGASKNGDEITINFRYDKYNDGYDLHFTDKEYVVKINYSGHTEGWEDISDGLENVLKKKYVLTNDQMMAYMLNNEEYAELYPYSSFIDDIESVCGECNVVQFSRGSADGNLGIIMQGFNYVIFRNDEPIYNGYVDLVGSFVMDVENIDDYNQFEHKLKRRIHDAYKKHKDKHRIANVRAFLKGETEETEFEYPIELEYVDSNGEAMSYKVTIDGHTLNTVVSLNFVEKEEDPVEDTTIKVEKITLNKENLNLEVGKSFKLVATVSPDNATNKKVKWSSSNEKVVKIVDGNVTAVGVGTATITVVSEDGNAKVSLNVSVIKAGIAGDIDGDGKVNIKDLVLLRKHLAEISILKGTKKDAADFNKDGKVNVKDLVNMRTYLSK